MELLRAHSWAEARMYLTVTPCPGCSRGPWEAVTEESLPAGQAATDGPVRALPAKCQRCGTKKRFLFECVDGHHGKADAADEAFRNESVERINPTDAHSEIIDLGQWLSLFYMLIEKAHASTKAESRRLGFQAAQCIEEALKFYTGDDELPSKSAFFVEASRAAFAEHPEKFARQRLVNIRSKLPDLRAMTNRIARDAAGRRRAKPGDKPTRPWWRFRRL